MQYKFENLTDDDVNLIGALLDEQPYKRVANLALRLQAQITQQIADAKSAAAANQKRALDHIVGQEIAKRAPANPPPRKRAKAAKPPPETPQKG